MRKTMFRWLIVLAIVLPCMVVAVSANDITVSLNYTDADAATYPNSTLSTGFTATGSGTIYYTLDGSDPSSSSTRKTYTSGSTITLSGHVTVRAVVYSGGQYGTVRTQKLVYLPGAGTQESPYKISDKVQLDAVRLNMTAYYQMTGDITFTATDFADGGIMPDGWMPISGSGGFTGSFDGKGHAIYGLSGSNGGLFESNHGTIDSVRIMDHTVYDNYTCGAVANYNSGTISRCYTKSAFQSAPSRSEERKDYTSVYVGGVVGDNRGTVQYCRNDGTVYGLTYAHYATAYVGGIVGRGGIIKSCYNTGEIVASNTYSYTQFVEVGGIATKAEVWNSRNSGNISCEVSCSYNLSVRDICANSNYNDNDAFQCIADEVNISHTGSSLGSGCSYVNDGISLQNGDKAALYPKLDFDTVWMFTAKGPVPQGLMYSDGTVRSLNDYREPTCTASGYATYVDDLTGDSCGNWVAPAAGHTEEMDAAVAPTCGMTGLTEGTHCAVCQSVISAQEIVPATGQHSGKVDAAKNATCTATGLTEGSHCGVCGQVLVTQEIVPATGHTAAVDEAVAPTCGTTGLTEGTHCSVCKEVIIAQEVVPATGQHGYQLDAAVEATCTESGLTVGASCPTCGYVHLAQEVVPATGHTMVTDSAVAATCTSTGLTEGSHCSVCDEVLVAQEETALADHASVTDPAVAATCTATGLTEGSHCGVCSEVLVAQEETPLTDHTPVTDPAVAPTCAATGLTEGSRCGVCGEVLVAQENVAKISHTVVIDQPKDPTCTEVGYSGTGMHCGVCGQVLLAQTEIPAQGHDYIDHAGKAPTTESAGWEAYQTCSRCDYTTYKELPKLEAVKPLRGRFSLEVVATITVDGQPVDICRWIWTPME